MGRGGGLDTTVGQFLHFFVGWHGLLTFGLVSGRSISWEDLQSWRQAAFPLAVLVIPQTDKMMGLITHLHVSDYSFQLWLVASLHL